MQDKCPSIESINCLIWWDMCLNDYVTGLTTPPTVLGHTHLWLVVHIECSEPPPGGALRGQLDHTGGKHEPEQQPANKPQHGAIVTPDRWSGGKGGGGAESALGQQWSLHHTPYTCNKRVHPHNYCTWLYTKFGLLFPEEEVEWSH